VAALFQRGGEPAFRSAERAALARVLDRRATAVIALGGGALLDAEARSLALARGLIVGLSAPAEVLVQRLSAQAGARPLLGAAPDLATMAALLGARAEAYRCAHLPVDAASSAADVAATITRRLRCGAVPVSLLPQPYCAWMAPDAAEESLADLVRGLNPTTIHLVADATAWSRAANRRLGAWEARAASFERVGPGEQAKSMAVLERTLSSLMRSGADRRSLVVAVGGGATSDLAGLAAALYARGIRWIAVPTTLLSMVDAALGGKTAVDLGGVKNPIGAFHQPSAVVVDPSLATEDERPFRAAMAEVVKSALVGDAGLLDLLERDAELVLGRDPGALAEVVRRALAVKARVVESDPAELGSRVLLNLGHTIGHTLEASSPDGLFHGEAVSLGLVAELRIGSLLGHVPQALAERTAALLGRFGLPIRPGTSSSGSLEALAFDKKRVGGEALLVVVRAPGYAEVVRLPQAELERLAVKLGYAAPLS
jgi:shikimate kinase/3-dehydroquinate synthase